MSRRHQAPDAAPRHEEDEVDRLLRGGTLVDLLNVVRQGVRASVESYSLKQIEKFYMPVREGPVTEAGFSVVEYERWMREHDQSILDGIAAYNRDDCVSTLMLRDWLEARDQAISSPRRRLVQTDLGGRAAHRNPVGQDGRGADTCRCPDGRSPRRPSGATAESRPEWLLAGLLDWHRRDEKPAWWLWHDLREKSLDDLIESSDGIAGLNSSATSRCARRASFGDIVQPAGPQVRVGEKAIDPNPRHGD